MNDRVKLRLQPSKVHGVGVFAIRDIKKGQKLYADLVPCIYNLPYSNFKFLFESVRELLLERWPNIVNGSAFLYPDARMQAYMNHSDTPNYDAVNDLALKTIKAGDEIFEDYRNIQNYAQIFPWLVKKD